MRPRFASWVDAEGVLTAFCQHCGDMVAVDEDGSCKRCGQDTGERPLSEGRIRAMRERLQSGERKRCEACEGLPHRRLVPRCPVCDGLAGATVDRQPARELIGSSAAGWREQ